MTFRSHHSNASLVRAASVAAALVTLPAVTANAMDEASPLRLGAGIEGGRVAVKSATPSEIDKSGAAYGVKAFAEIRSRWLTLMLGASQQSATLSGIDDSRGVGQDLTVSTANAQSTLFLNLGSRFSLGYTGRVHQGPSADYGVQADNVQKIYRDAGPSLRASLPFLPKYSLTAETTWLRSLKSDDRKVNTILATLSASIPLKLPSLGKVSLAAKAPLAPGALQAISSPDGAWPALHFKHASDELEDESQKDLQLIIDSLKNSQLSGYRVSVNGFGSRTGSLRRTMEVSLQRAQRIAGILQSAGVSTAAIDVAAFGSTDLLMSEAPDGDRQRRVVVSLKKVASDSVKTGSYSLSMSRMRIPPALVYRADELWSMIEMRRALGAFATAEKAVSIDVPGEITGQRGTWAKVSEGMSILATSGIKIENIRVRATPRSGDILFRVESDDSALISRLESIQQRRERLIAVPATIDNAKAIADTLLVNSGAWDSVETSLDIREKLAEYGLPSGRISLRRSSRLWSQSFGTVLSVNGGSSGGVLLVHARRRSESFRNSLMVAASTTPRAHSPETPSTSSNPAIMKPQKNLQDDVLRLMAKPPLKKPEIIPEPQRERAADPAPAQRTTPPAQHDPPASPGNPWNTLPRGQAGARRR